MFYHTMNNTNFNSNWQDNFNLILGCIDTLVIPRPVSDESIKGP